MLMLRLRTGLLFAFVIINGSSEQPRKDYNSSTKNYWTDSKKKVNGDNFRTISQMHFLKFTRKDSLKTYSQFQEFNLMKPLLHNASNYRWKREDIISNPCYKFEEGDKKKREFYSPNFPLPYPKNLSCYKVLEADSGKVLKIEFRDNFELEDHSKCSYDFLEVRDGKYGYSRPIGNYCRAFPFPEITSSSKYLWLHFHSDSTIQGSGFRAVWDMIPRPQVKTPEAEECVLNITNLFEYEIKTVDIESRKKKSMEQGTELDCLWNITVPNGYKIQMTFPKFDLDKPNECDINYVQVYDEEPFKKNNPSLISNFCGSIADLVTSKGNVAYLRFFVTKAAMRSSFEAIMTAIREKGKDKDCKDDEFDCQDACISEKLKCNNRPNCRYRFDEDQDVCNTDKSGLSLWSEHVIILSVFMLLILGLCGTCTKSCIKSCIRDQKVIKEHLRQSRERELNEFNGKKTSNSLVGSVESLPCHYFERNNSIISNSTESPNLEVLNKNKELAFSSMQLTSLSCAQFSNDMNDIHQNNNIRNATQERLQESIEEYDTRDMACQTKESIFNSQKILLENVAITEKKNYSSSNAKFDFLIQSYTEISALGEFNSLKKEKIQKVNFTKENVIDKRGFIKITCYLKTKFVNKNQNEYLGIITNSDYKLDVIVYKQPDENIDFLRGSKLEIIRDLQESNNTLVLKVKNVEYINLIKEDKMELVDLLTGIKIFIILPSEVLAGDYLSQPYGHYNYPQFAENSFSSNENSKKLWPEEKKYTSPHLHSSNSQFCLICNSAVSSEVSSASHILRNSKSQIVPAPPGWSADESAYNIDCVSTQNFLDQGEKKQQNHLVHRNEIFQRISLESRRNNKITAKISPKEMSRQKIVGSGENYGSLYETPDPNNTDSVISNYRKSENLKIVKCPTFSQESKFKAEASIEIHQKRPFSIDSSKSAPDVIATH